jgi:hypothetical protein
VIEVITMQKVTRQIRIAPDVEEMVQKVADTESRTFSNCADWLLRLAATRYLSENASNSSSSPSRM